MIINKTEYSPSLSFSYLNIFPDQFKTEEEKKSKMYVKNTMDYFANIAYAQYRRHRDTFTKNYDLRKGIIDINDFYKEPQVRSFAETILGKEELPDYVKHYSIINPPFNTMIGELAKRPDIHKIRAFDEDSQSAEMQYRTERMQDFILQQERANIYRKLQATGEIDEIPEEEIEQMTLENVKEDITNYTSAAERWGNDVLRALKARFVMKEKSEDAFADLLTTNREFFLVDEDNSKVGFGVQVINPKNEWHLGVPDVKYTSGASGRKDTAYAAGTVHIMEISEIIEEVPELTMEEVNHLRKIQQDHVLLSTRSSFDTVGVGQNTIKYDTFDPLVEQERAIVEAELKENKDDIGDWIGLASNSQTFGYKFAVVRSYHLSKKKVGMLTYMDEDDNILTVPVDETYKEGSPGEISIEWGWVNQWYKGLKIGSEIYHLKPFELLDYCPIIGLIHEIKNTESKSLIDLMKPYQALFNVCMNQLWERLEKDWGMVYRVQLRRIPTPKDGDPQDAIQVWEEEARSRGVVFEDDSPENLKTQLSNTTTSGVMDLSRHNEIQVRYNLAVQLMQLCWSLVGVNEQRLGASQATDTATAIQTNLTQSYTQTEPYFAAHEYVMDQVYQAMVDAAQHIESKKPLSTISYITSEGVNAFTTATPQDIRLKDLWVINVSSPEDQQLFKEIRSLSQAMLQNGAHPYEIVEMYSTNSMRQLKDIFKNLKQAQDELIAQQQQQAQQQIDQQAEIAENQLAEEARQKEIDRINENYNKEQDRLSKERIAIITATGFGKVEGEDTNANALPDVLEASRLSNEIVMSQKDFEIKMREFEQKERELRTKRDVELEKLKVDRENQKNDLAIARLNAKGRAQAKKSTAKSKKK